MSAKTIIIIISTVLVTIILMKNMDEVNFWIFGTYTLSKLLVLGTIFLVGVVVGWLLGRPKKKLPIELELNDPTIRPTSTLSERDRDYLDS